VLALVGIRSGKLVKELGEKILLNAEMLNAQCSMLEKSVG
jgi:hypothetical protein